MIPINDKEKKTPAEQKTEEAPEEKKEVKAEPAAETDKAEKAEGRRQAGIGGKERGSQNRSWKG